MAESNAQIIDKPTLWVVSELYYPEMTSTGYYLTQTAEGLTDRFTVKALCGQPNYSARGTIAEKHEFHNGVEIFRAAGTTLNKNIIPFRLLNMFTLGLSVFFLALRKFQGGDRVLVVTTPPTLPFVVAVASMFKGSVYTLLIHDNYPEILIAAGKTKKGGILTRSIDRCNRWLYKNSTAIIAVGRDMQAMLRQKVSGLDIPVHVIQNWAELETVSPRPRNENKLLAELGLGEKLVFLYAGNLGHPNDVETIISAAERLNDDDRFHFIFLGSGVKQNIVDNAVSRGLTNISMMPPRPRSEQIDFLNSCDIGIVSLISKMRSVSMPSRTYNILAAGKPILALAEPGSEIDLVIKDDNVGWCVSPGDTDALVETILSILTEKDRLAELGHRARNAALARYSLDAALKKYREVLGH